LNNSDSLQETAHMPDMDAQTVAVVAIVIAAGSEIIALTPLKSNSWIQLLLQALRLMFPKR
jgi:hypothetical protein